MTPDLLNGTEFHYCIRWANLDKTLEDEIRNNFSLPTCLFTYKQHSWMAYQKVVKTIKLREITAQHFG